MGILLFPIRYLWDRHWRLVLMSTALVVVFVLGMVFGQQLTLGDLGPTPTAPALTPAMRLENGVLLILKGDILDAETGQPVSANVFVDDEQVRQGVTQVELAVKPAADRLTEIRVEAPDYYPWGIAVRGGGKGQRMEGPILLTPIKPTVPGVQTG